MNSSDDRAYRQFLLNRATDLRRIARNCRGEAELGDVQNQVWLVAQEIQNRRGHPIIFDDPSDQELLLGHRTADWSSSPKKPNATRSASIGRAPAMTGTSCPRGWKICRPPK